MSQLTLLSLLIFSSLITLSHSFCNPIDKKALLEIKNQLGPKASIFDTWQPNTDCCVSWNNVGCNNRTNRVSILTIGSDELAGSIPTVIGELSGLELLYLNDMPGLVGPIPEAISKLPNLNEMMLSRTNLTGPIPDFMSRLQKLEILDLSENRLSGPMPSSLSQLPNLVQLQVQNNRLSGSIPDSFGSFKKLGGFQADNNLLSGPLPKSLGRVGFSGLVLSNNRLTGDASHLFGKSKKAILIQLNNNAFSFDFSKIEFPHKLRGLDVSQNMIYGSIPAQVAQVPLELFNVSSNQLCGQIPTGKWVKQFGADSFAHNKCLCGSPLAPCK